MIRANFDISKDRPPEDEPKFSAGQLVKHKRYGYRGVVVDYDEICQADEQWYANNKTQPEKKQPWYHVLVHDSQTTTYPAQNSLIPDDSKEPVNHPLVQYFFSSFSEGEYVRNDREWPK